MLCIGSPVTAWLTSRIERRTLLTAVLAVLAITNIASAFAPDYASLLAIRLIMLAIGVIYTPQAAGTAALIVPVEKRGSTIAYIFLGWSLAAAAGLPLITFIASRYGWQAAYAGIGALGVVSFVLLAVAPARKARRAAGRSQDLARSRPQPDGRAAAGDHAVADVGSVHRVHLHGAVAEEAHRCRPGRIGLVFALYGVFGFLGIAFATRIVDSWGAYRTSLLFTSLIFVGIAGWALSAGIYAADGGLGCGLGARLCRRPIRCSRCGWWQRRRRLRRPRCRSTPPCSMSGRRSVRRSAAFSMRPIFCIRSGFVGAMFVALALAIVFATRPRSLGK